MNDHATLYKKLAEVASEVENVTKAGWNDFHKYHYVTERDLVDAVRAKLSARNVILIPSVDSIEERHYQTDKGKHSVVTTTNVSFTFACGDTGATHTASWAGQGDDPADKGIYKAYTGALKYFLMKTFLIPTGDDPEGDSGADRRGQQRQSASSPVQRSGGGTRPASEKQVKFASSLAKDLGIEVVGLEAKTSRDVSQLILQFQVKKGAREKGFTHGQVKTKLVELGVEDISDLDSALGSLTLEQGQQLKDWLGVK